MCFIPLPHYYISWVLWIICIASPSPIITSLGCYGSYVLHPPPPLLHLLGVIDHMCCIPLPHYYISWVLWIISVASPSPIITSLGCYGSYVLHPSPPLLYLGCYGSYVLHPPPPLLHLLGVMDHMCWIPLPHYYISWVLWIICVASPSPIITSLGCYGSYVLHPSPPLLYLGCYGSYVLHPPPPLLHLLGIMDHKCCIPLSHYHISWVLWIICVASPSPIIISLVWKVSLLHLHQYTFLLN